MIEHDIKAATCRVSCGNQAGTGWMITKERVITARHCVVPGFKDNEPIKLFFQDKSDTAVPAKIIAESEETDMCLLSVDSTTSAEPLAINLERPHAGQTWQAFSYPQSKSTLGHRLTGTVAQVLDTVKLKIDLDLSIDPAVALQDYRGSSGAAVVCDAHAVGVIRLKVDGTVAALSLHQLEGFLTENGVVQTGEEIPPNTPLLADRGVFSRDFAEAVRIRAGRYVFLEGPPGYGKSTFCGNFQPYDEQLINLGAYCLSTHESSLGADYRAQPQVFLDWLTTTISGLITGQPPRKEEKSYTEQVREAAQYLDAFSNFCAIRGRPGILFLDGLNEIPAGPLLGQLVGLLPNKLPPHIIVVLTAPNFTSMAAALAGRVRTSDILTLPPLPNSACHWYCQQALHPERWSVGLADRICEKARGHPLYLRYLIEYANYQTTDDSLDSFLVLSGTIEDYYRGIWTRLLPDEGAVNLLSLVARLRWGIPLAEFSKALNPTEQAQFVSVISRIRHLLADAEYTGIYHASFATFIIEQTSQIDGVAYGRLALFCQQEKKLRYCVLNRIFHFLRAADKTVFAACNQEWCDEAVTLGVEPDALIADVEEVVSRAAVEASADEFFPLMLLMQRISFRYDTLFAQSARSIAEALISLGRPREALQHVFRLKTLIVGPDDALEIGLLLHQYGYDEEALILLDRVQCRIIESYGNDMPLVHFLAFCSLHIRTVFLMRLASGGSGMNQFKKIVEMARHACEQTIKNDPSEVELCMCPVACGSVTYFLTFQDEYTELARLKTLLSNVPPRFLRILCTALLQFESAVNNHRLSKRRTVLSKLFADLAELAPVAELEPPLVGLVTDTLIRFGAPTNVVVLFGAKGGKRPPRPLQIKANNGVDVNHRDLKECLALWRVAAFLDAEFRNPNPGVFLSTGWLDALERLIGTLYWCDGKARRAMADGDEAKRIACRDTLKSQVLDQLRFGLKQRASWRDSYAVPENTLPAIYRQLVELLRDCFPEELPEWLDSLAASAEGQWGMYTEGFRESAFQLLNELMRTKPTADVAPRLLKLLHVWRAHVMRGVENRHELILEILRLIPPFVELGATEEADKLYAHLLSVSMGPTWYKEDQLSLMTSALRSIPIDKMAQQRFPKIAGYLERADGEMTFQRYVRAEKSGFLEQIARQGRCRAAIAYFRRQCCSSVPDLWAEAQQGAIDKVGPLQGNRFPGGALDEQASILALVQGSVAAPWALRWALLEIFHCGEDRHLGDYGKAFAKIANEAGGSPELIRRAILIADVETASHHRQSFALSFRNVLRPGLHNDFAAVLAGLSQPEPPEPKVRQAAADGDADRGLFLPGVFGHQEAMRQADKILEEARQQRTLGNLQVAKAHAVKVLQTLQEGGWSIWDGNLSDSAKDAEAMLAEGESTAMNVIRHYGPLLAAERYAPRWRQAQHLIGNIGALLTEAESRHLLDATINHVQLMVGSATREIEEFNFLAHESPDENAALDIFRLILWLCDHPQELRRDRAAAMLLWLVELVPDLFSPAATTAFSMEEGYGPDVLCGVLDGASAREPLKLWNMVANAVDLKKITNQLRHVSRMAVLLRLTRRAADAGSTQAKIVMAEIQAAFIRRGTAGGRSDLPSWANCLAREWRRLEKLVHTEVAAAWSKELNQLCEPLSIAEARTLEQAVSSSFREDHNRPLNRWESKVRHALNLALWSHVSFDEADKIENILRPYNPSQPERTVQAVRNPITDQLMAAVKSADFSTVLGKGETLLLNYHDVAVRPDEERTNHLEVLCVLQPASKKKGFFPPTPAQTFRSSESPNPIMDPAPVETCYRLLPEVVFFGHFTPSVPLPFFKMLVGAKDEDFVRHVWRWSRRDTTPRFGQPEREGCSLSVARTAIEIPSGHKLTWIVWLDGELVAFVDENNNSLL